MHEGVTSLCRYRDRIAELVYLTATGRRQTFEWEVAQEEELGEMERRANKCWEAGGGWRGEKKRRKVKSEAALARRAAEQARRFKRHMSQGEGSVTGLSGGVLGSVGERINIDIEPNRSQRAKRKAAAQSAGSLERRLFESGRGFDRWDRWRVERVVEVRKRRTSGRHGAR